MGLVILSGLTTILITFALLNLSNRLHNSMLLRVARAPMTFFTSNPLGRIINRFSKDTAMADSTLIDTFSYFLQVNLSYFSSSITSFALWESLSSSIPISRLWSFSYLSTLCICSEATPERSSTLCASTQCLVRQSTPSSLLPSTVSSPSAPIKERRKCSRNSTPSCNKMEGLTSLTSP